MSLHSMRRCIRPYGEQRPVPAVYCGNAFEPGCVSRFMKVEVGYGTPGAARQPECTRAAAHDPVELDRPAAQALKHCMVI
jgi:hypothetical protein